LSVSHFCLQIFSKTNWIFDSLKRQARVRLNLRVRWCVGNRQLHRLEPSSVSLEEGVKQVLGLLRERGAI